MKKILLITMVLAMCSGPALAGELKVMVPVNDFKQMNAKIEQLEKENSQLKQMVNSASASESSSQELTAMQARLSSLQNENSNLRQQIEAGGGQASADMAARLSALEGENSQLRDQLAKMQASPDSAMEAKLAEADSQNRQLEQEIKAVKEGAITAAIIGDKSTARQLYASARHARSYHNFKF